ncbi:hypothetical protein EIN_026140 [Entamoeba invadens IP1]|uniref:hypothetical protein n=1 Tax=Entamoeba invadens IP1 TaxID=370355 RepID=UPI0002C3D4DE|nr:hypothetical protein EIN_026140 [Entamoeba invadens IP1]ELP90765.1 hypothetical protein EIN_026140 [Entamoeba invadens IP1]|eukprot:XP_004257536.1 hypothetical protein EIN_026140 [Entamoeba invadens IP1]
MSSTIKRELFGSLMDEKGYIDPYVNAKEIARIALANEYHWQYPLGEFVRYCIQNDIDPALEMIRLEEHLEKPKDHKQHMKIYSINKQLLGQCKYLNKKYIRAIQTIKTNDQLTLLIDNIPLVRSMEKVVQSIHKEIGTVELVFESYFETLLCCQVAHYYNLKTKLEVTDKITVKVTGKGCESTIITLNDIQNVLL